MASSKRRLWEFNGSIICRLLGLTFEEKELGKIFKKLEHTYGQRSSAPSEMHGILVQTCAKPSTASKDMEKILEERFEPYRWRVRGLDQEDICKLVEDKDGYEDVPLPALVWFAVRNQHEEIDRIEARIFSTLHQKEHKALRFYDTLSRVLPNGEVEGVVEALKDALKVNKELQRRYERAEGKKEQLRSEIEAMKEDKSRMVRAQAEQWQQNETLRNELEKLGGEPALDQIQKLKKEMELLAQEVKTLTQELLRQELYGVPHDLGEPLTCHMDSEEEGLISCVETEQEQDAHSSLEGVRVAFVGGLESLAPYHRHVVECLGGVFCDQCRECSQGKKEIERFVDTADVVFCPVDINSHHCCRCVKKVCKLRGKPCYSLRSSSLSMFRRELVDFAMSSN